MEQNDTKTTSLSNRQMIQQPFNKLSSVKVFKMQQVEITQNLCSMIINGQLIIAQQQHALSIIPQKKHDINKKTNISSPVIVAPDPNKHLQLVRKFIKERRRLKRRRQMSSLELQQRSKKQLQSIEKLKYQSKIKTIQTRRSQIQQRMEAKKNLLKQLQKSILQNDSKVKDIRKKKFLYQEKEEKFAKQFIIPKNQEAQKILKQRKQIMKQIDMRQLKNHQLKYKNSLVQQSFNRINHSRMTSTQWKTYQPPQFVPRSFRLAQQEAQFKTAEQQLKKRQHQINKMKTKIFVEQLQAIHQQQRQNQKKKVKQTGKKQSHSKQSSHKIVQLSREQAKNLGNDYMKEIFKTLSRTKYRSKRLIKLFEEQQKIPKRVIKSQLDLQLDRQDRIKKIEKIRLKKIQEITKNNKDNKIEKFQKLKMEANKLDQMLNRKEKSQDKGINISDLDDNASLVLSSIQAKIAMLDIAHFAHFESQY